MKALRENKQEIEEKLVLKKEKVYILKDEELRLEVIRLHHNAPVARYRDRQKTIVRV